MLIFIAAAAATVCDAAVDRVLASHPTIVEYCERCGDKAPGMPHPAQGRPTDLASTYVKTSDVRYQNLALLANCIAEPLDVPSLKVLDETPTGVLIVPDTTPVDAMVVPDVAMLLPDAMAVPNMPPPLPPEVHTTLVIRETATTWPYFVAGAAIPTWVIAGLALHRRRKRVRDARKLGRFVGPRP
jgi:hypothetical protein